MHPAPKPQPPDQAARERLRTALDVSFLVEASAGTGKTTELVNRIVAVLASGATTVDRIAAVTFTNKAAGELKLRVRQELDLARHNDPAHRLPLEAALAHLEEASIGTIHSFCAQILRERPVEAKVDPAFEEISEPEANRLYRRAFHTWLERRLNQDSPGLRRAFARLAHRDSWDTASPLEQLQFAGRKLIEWRDYPGAWQERPFSREEEILTLLRMARELAQFSARPRRVNDNLFKGLEPARLFDQWTERAEDAGARDFDTLESLLLKLARDLRRDTRKGSGEYGGGVTREDLITRRDELLHWIDEFKRRADASLACQLRAEMQDMVEEYEQRKQRQGKLDFVDLLIKTRDLLYSDPSVRHYLQQRYTHLFVDEFQDTDPLQAEILMLLASDDPQERDWLKVRPVPGKLFLVGDPKQSIYKFRRADLELYRGLRERLQERGVETLSLTCSFRAVPNVQAFVNAAFAPEMGQGDGHADWSPLERFRPAKSEHPSVIALPIPAPYSRRGVTKTAVNAGLPKVITAFIDWLLNQSGWGFEARDIAVLFRRRVQNGEDLTRHYARSLEARGIPHLLAGSKSFHQREEVEVLRAALAAIEWPDDELSVYATLKGPLFSIPDEALLVYRLTHRSLHPFRPNDEPRFAVIRDALEVLARLHRERNQRPFASTVNDLIEATRAHAGFLLRPGGHQVLANVARVAELARGFEIAGGVSFRGFVEELNHQAEKEEAAEAPVLEEDSDGVRLMTVHGAKGLEFKCVILADFTSGLQNREPDQYIDGFARLSATRLLRCAPWELLEHEVEEATRERAEGVRVAYVAATRAEDLLVIPSVGDGPFPADGWLSPLNKALYPQPANFRQSQPVAGCPDFGSATVLERPPDFDLAQEPSVRPGLIQPGTGTQEVVWWDPALLDLEIDDDQGHQKGLQRLLEDDQGASFAQYNAWAQLRAEVVHKGAHPEWVPFLASQAPDSPPGDIPVEIVPVFAGSRAASGRRFGSLVHAVLSEIPLDASAAQVESYTRLIAKVLGATDEERSGAIDAVHQALQHPVLDQARRAERCHREYPIALPIENARVMEGILDLAFVADGGWVVVDFKTDADGGARSAQYLRQLQWYVYALTTLTGLPGRGVLLAV